jgi:hypothetical protein
MHLLSVGNELNLDISGDFALLIQGVRQEL